MDVVGVDPQVLQLLQRSDGRRYLAGETVVRQIDKLELVSGGEIRRNPTGEGVGGEVEYPHARRNVAGDFAGDEVVREVQNPEIREVGEECRGNLAGERVVLQVDGAEERAFREGARDGAVEIVGVQAQPLQLAQVRQLVGEAAGELEARQAELDDGAGGASNATPIAGGGRRGRIPAGQCSTWVAEIPLEGQQRLDLGVDAGGAC